jgi:hypothetical protein
MPLRREILALPCVTLNQFLPSDSPSVYDLLPDLLTSVGAQLRSAWRHNGIGWRDVCLLAPISSQPNAPPFAPLRIEEENNILSLIKLRLQYLTMILHALNICLCLLRSTIRTRTRGVDVPIGEDGRRHIESKCVNCFCSFCDCCMCDVLF